MFVTIRKERGEGRELGAVRWEDDGAQAQARSVDDCHFDVLPEARRVITGLASA